MTNDKPSLPKRLAAKIVAAQKAVTAARSDLHYSAQSLAQDQSEVAEYERDPVAYAAKYYRGMPVDSYPVQTRMRRKRDDVARRLPRQQLHRDNLAAAEGELARVEQAVLDEVMRMRPTPGRVDWPAPLPPLEVSRAQWRRKDAEQEQAWEAQRARENQEAAAQEAEAMRALDAQNEAEWAQWRADVKAHWATLSEAELAKEKAQYHAFGQAVRDGLVFEVVKRDRPASGE